MELPNIAPITASRQPQSQAIPEPADPLARLMEFICQQLAEAKISYTFSGGQIFCSPEDLPRVVEIASQNLHSKQLQGTIFVNQ